MTCPNCSAAIEPDSRFCKHCGSPLTADRAAAAGFEAGPGPVQAAGTSSVLPSAGPGNSHRDPAREQDVWSGRPCWRAGYGLWLLWAAGALGVLYAAHRYSEAGSPVRTAAWVLAGAAGMALLVRDALTVLGTGYRLTTQRLFVQTGILSRVMDQIELVRVDDVRLRQGLIDRIVNTGDVEIISSDPTHENLWLDSIAEPMDVMEKLRANVRASRSRGTLFVENV